MSFDTYESSRELGEPITLLLFRVGPGDADVIGYTDAETPINWAPDGSTLVTFKPAALSHDDTKTTGTLDKTAFNINISTFQEIVDIFRIYPPSYVVSLVMYQGHANDQDGQFLAFWTGRIRQTQATGMNATLTGDPVSSILARPGMRRTWQYGCPYALYGSQCKAQKLPQALTLVSVLSGNSVRVLPSGTLAKPAVNFTNGTIEWFGPSGRRELGNIAKVTDAGSGNYDMIITRSTQGLVTGQAMKMALGCNHQMDDCTDVFDNILNYGGDPWIPLTNPVNNIRTYL